MHILVTNDDGPPSPQSSPYVHCLIRHLQKAGHTISVCLPHTQRSWIGKAHMIGQTLKPLYYRPAATSHGDDSEGTTHRRPSPAGDVEEWILIDGTPASCVQIGLHHFFEDRGPIDLVLSGPNYGRNTTAVFALSSGTLGAALEAAVCQRRAIALSFAFFTRNHDPDIIEGACRHSVRVIDALWKQWPTDGTADLYSVNVPLVEGVEEHKTIWTDVLQNYWRDGSCFQEIEGEADHEADEEEKIREGTGGEVDQGERPKGDGKGHLHKHFKWAPRFSDVYKSVEEAPPGNDGWAVKEGHTSVTPLKANFAAGGALPSQKELKLPDISLLKDRTAHSLAHRAKDAQGDENAAITAIVAYQDDYVQPLILDALSSVFKEGQLRLLTDFSQETKGSSLSSVLPSPDKPVFQILPYEEIDFDYAMARPRSCLVNSYMIRKAVIRKHYLSATVDHWVAKNPESVLKSHVKRSEAFEVDYAEFLDDALVEAFDLRESMERNEDKTDDEREWWILKPGMSDRGQGIRLFSTMEELQAIFDGWDEDRPDSDDEAEDEDEGENGPGDAKAGDYVTTSHLRHFVAQPYIHPPLLAGNDGRKFHIRTYVLCAGALKVYVYKPMLALFAAKPYTAPSSSAHDIETFLTNTCLQDSPNANSVSAFWDLPLAPAALDAVFAQICEVAGEVFEAAARAMPVHFQALPNAVEVFGLDFLVDEAHTPWLLEVNAFPDFRQTGGGDLRNVVGGFWEGVVRLGVAPFFGLGKGELWPSRREEGDMRCVRDVDLGRR